MTEYQNKINYRELISTTEFQGIWINQSFGGWNPELTDRFKSEMPKCDLRYADKPTWISREAIEKKYGKVKEVGVISFESEDLELLIYTTQFVITLEERDGYEYLVALPRNPPTTQKMAILSILREDRK